MLRGSITRIHCPRMRTTVEDHGCTDKGRHTTRTLPKRFSTPMPLLLLYHAPSFGCSLFFVLCKNRLIDKCMDVRNVIREFIWTAATLLFPQVRTRVFLAHTVYDLFRRNGINVQCLKLRPVTSQFLVNYCACTVKFLVERHNVWTK